MVDMANVGVQQILSRGLVPLAIQAGIETVIASLTAGLAKDQLTLLRELKEALENDNPALAAALNIDSLRAIMDYIGSKANASVMFLTELPETLDQDGPAGVWAARDGGVPTQINVTYSEPPTDYTGEIYVDGVFAKHSTEAPASGVVNDSIAGVAAGPHVIRVLFRRDSDGAITRFGPIDNSEIES